MTTQLYDLCVVYVRQIPTRWFSSAGCSDLMAGGWRGWWLIDAK